MRRADATTFTKRCQSFLSVTGSRSARVSGAGTLSRWDFKKITELLVCRTMLARGRAHSDENNVACLTKPEQGRLYFMRKMRAPLADGSGYFSREASRS